MEQTSGKLEAQSIDVERFATESVRESWDAFKTDPVLYILASLIVAVVGLLSLGILFGPLAVGMIDIIRRRRRGEPTKVGDVWQGTSAFAPSFVAFLLLAIAMPIGFALLFVPGLIVAAVACFAFHEIAYRKLSAVAAIKGSFQIAKQNVLHVLLLLVAMALLGAVNGAVPFAGVLTAPFSIVLTTVAYEKLTGQTPPRASTPIAV